MLDGMGREEMRAADTDRQRVADQLRAALDQGRLDLGEYDERLRDAYAAKTYADLDRLLADLPDTAPVMPAAPAVIAEPRRDGAVGLWLGHIWGPWAKAVAITTLIWAISSMASGELVYYWPVWVAGPWGVVLLFRTIGGLAQGEPRRHAALAEHRHRLRAYKREPIGGK